MGMFIKSEEEWFCRPYANRSQNFSQKIIIIIIIIINFIISVFTITSNIKYKTDCYLIFLRKKLIG
jgi:hypothetical protein